MKKSHIVVFSVIVILLVFFVLTRNDEILSHSDYNQLVLLGYSSESITDSDIIHQESIDDKTEIIVFEVNKSIGYAFINKNKDKWEWIRNDVLYSIESDSLNYDQQLLNIESPDNRQMFMYFVRVFNSDIKYLSIDFSNYENETIYSEHNYYVSKIYSSKPKLSKIGAFNKDNEKIEKNSGDIAD